MTKREYLIKTSGGPDRQLLAKVESSSRLEAAYDFLISKGYTPEQIGMIGESQGPITTCRKGLFKWRQITVSHPNWSDDIMTRFGNFAVETPPYI